MNVEVSLPYNAFSLECTGKNGKEWVTQSDTKETQVIPCGHQHPISQLFGMLVNMVTISP